jgi:hypothetical protein
MVWWKRRRPGTRRPQGEPAGDGVTRRELLKGAYSTAVATLLFGGGAVAAGCDAADPRAPTGHGGGGYSDFAAYGYSDSFGYHDVAYADAAYDDAYEDGYDDGATPYGDGYDDGYDDAYGDYSDYGDGYADGGYDDYANGYADGGYGDYGDYADGGYGDYSDYSDYSNSYGDYGDYSNSYGDYSNYSDSARPQGPHRSHRPRHK